jgi:hypothetical protein
MYVYCHHSDLWRDVVLRTWPNDPVNYVRSWKETYMHTRRRAMTTTSNVNNNEYKNEDDEDVLHKPIAVDGIFSSMLHRAWSCHSCDLATACPGFFQYNDIDRVDAADLTVDQFIARYELPNKPVVIKKAVDDWAALKAWSPQHLSSLEKQKASPQLFRATSAMAPLAANFTLEGYFKYARQAREEAPLYLFERDFAVKVPELEADYDVPRYFRNGERDGTNAAPCKNTDLFGVLGREARPDYRWLICGPKKSGSIFHIDPNQTNAWNVSVQGRKKWIFYPPSVSPPGVMSSADGADVTVPICIGEWLLSFWEQHLEMRKDPDRSQRPLEVIVNPGDVIFVPHGFWHMVINLDDCIALTHNYVSTSNLVDCLRFLKDKPDQVSGVRDRPSEAVQPEEIYETFVRCLRGEVAPMVLDAALARQHERDEKSAHQLKKRSSSSTAAGAIQHPAHHSKSKKRRQHDDSNGGGDGERKQQEFSFGFSF